MVCCLIAASRAFALAGTTGDLSGRIIDSETKQPVSGASVVLSSPSASAHTSTDQNGGYLFLSLAPDTYTLAVETNGYHAYVQSGIIVQADQSGSLTISLERTFKTIASTTSRPSGELVTPGQTNDVYSVGPAGAQAARALAGPGALNQAYSALAAVPGVFVPQGQQGWYQPIFIRGGDQDQIGYELDGITVNRSYDNAPMSMLSRVGQQELQVYTGAGQANSSGQGISGYINQVIKTGTQHAGGTVSYGLGFPAGYQQGAIEYGGASRDGRLTYYASAMMANQGYRFADQFNGASLYSAGFFDPSFLPSPANLPGLFSAAATTRDREVVANLHYALPHKHDAGRDDIQLLYVNSELWTDTYGSFNDMGGIAAFSQPLTFPDQYVYTGAQFAPLDAAATQQYWFPNSQDIPGRSYRSAVPNNLRPELDNGLSVVKGQYQRNFGTHAYLRGIGYALYSNWFINGPFGVPYSYEYVLPNHTFGIALEYANQLSAKHLLSVAGSIDRTQESRYYPTGIFLSGYDIPTLAGSYIDPNGHCYSAATGAYASCFSHASQALFSPVTGRFLPLQTAPPGTPASANGAQWIATENGYSGNLNQVSPILYAAAASDVYRPSDKLIVDGGVRVEKYLDRLVDEAAGYSARQFWFNAFNNEFCFGNALLTPVARKIGPASGVAGPCPAGTAPVNLSLQAPLSESNSVFEPRLGFTYQFNPDRVLRASYGTYARPPNASWIQYGVTQQNLASYIGTKFLPYGFTTPVHDLRPDVSHNLDLSLEQRLHGTDMSFKISPYYRGTMDQFENILLNASGAKSGINVGEERSYGIEFAFTKGDFVRNGLSLLMAFAYDHSRFHYGTFANGSSVIDNINRYVKQYNAYTSFCAQHSRDARCGSTTTGAPAAPCYSAGGAPAPCSAGSVANPYFDKPAQPLFDPNGDYMPYSVIPDEPFLGGNGFGSPVTATLLLSYKHARFTVSPSLTYSSGSSYGTPLSTPGIDPLCTKAQCSSIVVPDDYTRRFDDMGAFQQPWRLTGNLQLHYDLDARTQVSLIVTSLFDHCGQRGYVWDNSAYCAYSTLPFGVAPSSTTIPNPDPNYKYPYTVQLGNNNTTYAGTTIPFQAYVTLQLKI